MSSAAVAAHYAGTDVLESIRGALLAAGKDLAALTPADLAPIDEFHVRGRAATVELAKLLAPVREERVIDIGCGLGGASRYLAASYGCHITGIDLTEEYVRAAEGIAAWLKLADRVGYRQADACALPFPDASFDLAWSQHAQMNIADKAALYAEMRRVLKPGGRFAFYDVLAGPQAPIHFPVPWARDAGQSHLATPEELQRVLTRVGFALVEWQDWSEVGRGWFAQAGAVRGAAPRALGLGLLLGPGAPAMVANLRRNLEEERIVLAAAVWRRE